MKKEDWFHSFGLVDDKYIDEAHPDRIVKPQRKRLIVSVIAACACFALLFSNLWLFVPFNTSPPDVSRYKGSEYYGLIQKLNELTFEKPKYKNNAEKLKDKLDSRQMLVFDHFRRPIIIFANQFTLQYFQDKHTDIKLVEALDVKQY